MNKKASRSDNKSPEASNLCKYGGHKVHLKEKNKKASRSDDELLSNPIMG